VEIAEVSANGRKFRGSGKPDQVDGFGNVVHIIMKPQICICCGEPMAERGHALSRNPNVCASCSSMADGMEESSIASVPEEAPTPSHIGEEPRGPTPLADEEVVLDWAGGQVSKRIAAAPK